MGLSKLAKGWRKGAVKGIAEDQYQLAWCYFEGKEGVKRDPVAAAAWFGKAAEQEHADALCRLGMCYATSEGVEQNHALAVTLYRKAADAGHAMGQGLLGNCYALATGLDQNDALAVAWWEKGAKGGAAFSNYILGSSYANGKYGLPKHAVRAKSFMKTAASQGHVEAVAALKLLNACAACGAPDASLTCGGCRPRAGISVARYCHSECQKKHWRRHKRDCGSLEACRCRNCRVSDRGESCTSAAPA